MQNYQVMIWDLDAFLTTDVLEGNVISGKAGLCSGWGAREGVLNHNKN